MALAPVGDSFVALPLSGATATRAGFLPAGGLTGPGPGPGPGGPAGDATVEDAVPAGAGSVRPIGPPRPTLAIAGCDPALPLLEAPLPLLDPPVAFAWWPCASSEALRLAAGGLVHAAGAHLRGSGLRLVNRNAGSEAGWSWTGNWPSTGPASPVTLARPARRSAHPCRLPPAACRRRRDG